MNKLNQQGQCLAISGGVGGAKLALGLSHCLSAAELSIVANTGDDFTHLGLQICPDIDTVMYTLSDLANKTLGWGQANETWQFLEALGKLGGEDWFRLGDKDLATHIQRSQLLASGKTLSEATASLCQQLGITHNVIPMSDQSIATKVHTKGGEVLSFQHYFVRDRCEPTVSGFHFDGIETAKPSPELQALIDQKRISSVLICPSNPFVSVDPILKIPGLADQFASLGVPRIAVSPIVDGLAIKGPAAKMMAELGMPQTAFAVAEHYQGRIDGFVIDQADAAMQAAIEALDMKVLVTNTVMKTLDDRVKLAKDCLTFVDTAF